MKDYILTKMSPGETGLYLCELPTGFGKTHTVVQAMREYSNDASNKKKLIYLTTLNKNLPEEELLAAFGGDEKLYRQKVLRIRSNFDEVTEKIGILEIPENFRTEAYETLLQAVELYRHAISEKAADQEYIKELQKRVSKAERSFRRELTRTLKNMFPKKEKRLYAIKNIKEWQWIGQLYPAVFTDEHQILLMSVSKFMKRNSTLIEPSYEFLKSDMLDNAVVFIDEFDATKATIQSEIIEKSLNISEEYIGLFKQVHRGLNPDYFSKTMKDACRNIGASGEAKYTFEMIRREASDIEKEYHINLSYKTAEEAVSRKQNFLLKDATYHTLFHNDKGYIRTIVNEDTNRVEIYFENREDFYSHKNDAAENISIYGLLRGINTFLRHFKVFLFEWARCYMTLINKERDSNEDAMTMESAASSILHRLDLSANQQALIMGELCNPMVNARKKELLPDNSFYQQGLELFELEDSDQHHDNTNLCLVEVYDTPEKILVYLSEKTILFGISATAEVGSVIGNYDLDYLREKLGDRYHPTPMDRKEAIRNELKKNWQAYKDGTVKIHTEVIADQCRISDPAEVLEKSFGDAELANVCESLITNCTGDPYYINRYCNLLMAMYHFLMEKKIQSFLYLGMALPKRTHPDYDYGLITQLFDTLKEYKNIPDADASMVVLKSEGFEEAKEALTGRLASGEKIFIISSYQTIGAGQNLQYKAPRKSELIELVPDQGNGDSRHVFKDIDALYLGDVTNLTANTYKKGRIDAEELMNMLFQIEELKMNSELNFQETDSMIKLAFRAYTGRGHYEQNLLYKTRSVKLQANRHVMQAVGRMCRTFLKSPDIYLYIEQSLLEKLSAGELRKHILPPEMKVLSDLRERLGKEYTDEEALILRRAEKISSYGMWNIRQVLSRNWTADSMNLWEAMRLLVLQHPTASKELQETNSLIQKLYITSGEKQNRYIYSQYSDFSDVTIDFTMDKIGFRNSGRAKKKSDTGEILVYEMSEAQSDLPVALKYPGMQQHFASLGFATEFKADDFMMSPVLFHNIYKGALGEAAGSFILQRELGIHLLPIKDPEKFEFFDFEMKPDVYVDFKNWKFTYLQDRESVKKNLLEKMNAIEARRVYIINLVGDAETFTGTSSVDSRIIEIPGLIDRNGYIIRNNLKMILEEDFA